jgi:hypothetical protein
VRKGRAGILIGIASAVGVLLLALANVGKTPPGPISSVHAQVEDLDGGQSCSSCHGGWFGNMRKACSECHEDVRDQIADKRGLHGRLEAGLAASCSTCHSEHHGPDFKLVNRLAFAQAGVPDPQRFDHRLVGFDMQGVHLTLKCADCHRHADAEVLEEGQKRFLGLSKDCSKCHVNPHGDRMQVGCATCHGQEKFSERVVPTHDRYLSIDGAHAQVGCRECHPFGSESALEELKPVENRHARGCADCHATPHGDAFLAGNAAAVEGSPKAVCQVCHPLEYPKFQDLRVTVMPAQHAHAGFRLEVPHDKAACESCHPPERDWAGRHPPRKADDCRICHADPHGGQFDKGPFAQRGCVGCHARTHFAPHEFDVERHARTSFPLEGRHEKTDCARCHADPAGDEPRQFHGIQNRCENCHADAHQGAFEAAKKELAANPRGICANCHVPASFADVDHAKFEHERLTGFATSGAHALIECTDCHERTAEPDANRRTFGRVVKAGAAFGGCATCHKDPHHGRFDVPTAPRSVDGRVGCERCHDTASFRALPHGFEHGRFTGFQLQGAHQKLDCVACHPPLATADDAGRTSSRPKGKDCADCHRDPHQGQFERFGRTDCARCHKSATSFGTLSFRHNLDSRFPLGEQHAQVPCAKCHKQERFGPVMAARYKPLPMECVDCHGSEGAPLRRRKG